MKMFREHVPLKPYSSYSIGGPARFFYEARTEEGLRFACMEAKRNITPVFIVGGATNLLIREEGVAGAVIKPSLIALRRNGEIVYVEAGVSIANLLDFCIEEELSGLEWSGGLPGTLGGAIRGNAGAFGGEYKDVIESVRSMDVETGKIYEREKDDCGFGYRTSIFKTMGRKEVILSATLALSRGEKNAILNGIEEKIQYRKDRHPMEYPNIGSIFKNIPISILNKEQYIDTHGVFMIPVKNDPFPIVPAAYFIGETGLKGVSYGGAMISPRHPNFIVNVCDATSRDVLQLIALAKHEVKRKFSVVLEEEVQII